MEHERVIVSHADVQHTAVMGDEREAAAKAGGMAKMEHERIIVSLAEEQHAAVMGDEREAAAKVRGTGIGKTEHERVIVSHADVQHPAVIRGERETAAKVNGMGIRKLEHERIIVRKACPADIQYAAVIRDEMEASAKARGTGIGKRPISAIIDKIRQGKAVIALTAEKVWVGFSYVEIWGHGEYVSNSGLIVNPVFRNMGVASRIKKRIFRLSRELYPAAKVFSITSGLAIMKMNTKLGFEPVTFSEITRDEGFWAGCKACVNYDILEKKAFKQCICTAMLYSPEEHGVRQAGVYLEKSEVLM
ncbi:hypothetical protein [Chitinophaga sancti]|uniref:hypothetical protein n=1 Tax=Chitinophaga sancti TaxID=1004 RepID=UPI003F79889B